MSEVLEVAESSELPAPGPRPTHDEVVAARDRHMLGWLGMPDPDGPHGRDVRAAAAMAARLAQLAEAEPAAAGAVAEVLAGAVAELAGRHAGCTVCGCTRCLYLADAGAVAQAWRPA